MTLSFSEGCKYDEHNDREMQLPYYTFKVLFISRKIIKQNKRGVYTLEGVVNKLTKVGEHFNWGKRLGYEHVIKRKKLIYTRQS